MLFIQWIDDHIAQDQHYDMIKFRSYNTIMLRTNLIEICIKRNANGSVLLNRSIEFERNKQRRCRTTTGIESRMKKGREIGRKVGIKLELKLISRLMGFK